MKSRVNVLFEIAFVGVVLWTFVQAEPWSPERSSLSTAAFVLALGLLVVLTVRRIRRHSRG
jgi:hypothetical protein